MTVEPSVVPGLLFLVAELAALTGVGYVIVRVALRETDHRVALAQGLVVGPAIWGVVVNLILYALPGMTGAVAGWIFVLALAAVLVWRSPESIRPRPHVTALFTVATLTLFCVVLASRQTLGIPDFWLRIALAAVIREGGFPPELPWNPGNPAPYHYGVYLLSGLLAPPSGPDLAFVEELLGAYAWTSLALVVGTALLRRTSGFASLVTTPLLITVGAWTLVLGVPESIVDVVVPAGIPAAGLRASLTDILWPSVELQQRAPYYALPNIWKPAFTLSYALAFVVIAQAVSARRRSWPAILTLAALVGFLGLISTSLAPIMLVLWAGVEAIHVIKSRRAGSLTRGALVRSASGLALAMLLMLTGSFSDLILENSVPSGVSLGVNPYFGGWRLLGTLERLPGGIGILGLGPLAVACIALLLARRNHLVLALASGAGLFVLASLALHYRPYPWELVRLEGHARNLALFALCIAVGVRLARLRLARWRYAAAAAVAALIVWPTVVAPARDAGLAVVGNGIELANAQRTQSAARPSKRFVLESIPSDRIATYIRNHTAVDARLFSPHPNSATFTTGRPNASGFAGLVHQLPVHGPGYRDVLDHLEPAAVRRLGFKYVHAPDSWVASLPNDAAERLNDPSLFELLVREESESLYGVLPAFLALNTPPAPASYEALRGAVPASATVFLPWIFRSQRAWRAAWALSHARLVGHLGRLVQLRSTWQIEPFRDHKPNFVVAPAQFTPWMFPAASRQPIWLNEETAVYSLDANVDQLIPSRGEPFPFSIRVSGVTEADGRIAFIATFDDRAPERWTSQDWILVATDASPLNLPKQVLRNGSTAIAMWFASYLNPGQATSSFSYEFDFRESVLAVRREGGVLEPMERSQAELDSDTYLLAVRLRHEYQPEYWRDAAVIPVLRITVSDTGEVSYQVHEDVGG